MGLYGDSLTVRRMRASGVVIFAAVLTTLVASALAATFAVYSGGVLPRAVRHDLATATGTTFLVTGPVDHDQPSQVPRDLPGQLKRALGPVPFRFDSALRSDPLGFVAGAHPAESTGTGDAATADRHVPIAEAAAFTGLTAHAVLLTGHWPGAPAAGQPLPAALTPRAGPPLQVQPRGRD